MHNIKCPHSSTKMNPKIKRKENRTIWNEICKTYWNHTWTKTTTSSSAQLEMPLSPFSLSLERPSLKLKSPLYWFTISISHIFSVLAQAPKSHKKKKKNSPLIFNSSIKTLFSSPLPSWFYFSSSVPLFSRFPPRFLIFFSSYPHLKQHPNDL